MAKRTPIKQSGQNVLTAVVARFKRYVSVLTKNAHYGSTEWAIDPKRINCPPKMRKPKKAKLAYGFYEGAYIWAKRF